MKPSLTKDAIQTMYAWLQGWSIEESPASSSAWFPNDHPSWNWQFNKFRIAKKQPKRKIPRTDDDPYK